MAIAILLLQGEAMAVSESVGKVKTVTPSKHTLFLNRVAPGSPITLEQEDIVLVGDFVGTDPSTSGTVVFDQLGRDCSLAPASGLRVKAQHVLEVKKGSKVWLHEYAHWHNHCLELLVEGPDRNRITCKTSDFVIQSEPNDTVTVEVKEGEVSFTNDVATQRGQAPLVVKAGEQGKARLGEAPFKKSITSGGEGSIVQWTFELERALIPREKFFITPDRKSLAHELQPRRRRARELATDADAWQASGDALFDSGHYPEALQEYDAADRLAPGQPATLLRLGYVQLELNHLDEAEAWFGEALSASRHALAPNMSATERSTERGCQRPPSGSQAGCSVLGDPTPGVLSQEPRTGAERPPSASEANPERERSESAPALVGLAWVALAHDRPAPAQAKAEEAVAADRTLAEAHIVLGLALMRQTGKLLDAMMAFYHAADAEPPSYRYQAHSWLAMVHLAQNDPDCALLEAEAATKLAPGSALAYANLAQILFFSDKLEKAVAAGNKAKTRNRASLAVRLALGQAQLAAGDADEAARLAAEVVALDAGLWQAHYLLGLANFQRHDDDHAEGALRKCRDLAPDFLPAASLLARVYTRTGRKEEAIALLTALLPRYPRADELLAARGQVYYEQARFKEAAKDYDAALAQNPDSLLYHLELARVHLEANHLPDALANGLAAVTAKPGFGPARAVLGLIYDRMGNSEQALREYRAALSLDSDSALARLGLGTSNPTAGNRVREVQRVLGKGSMSPMLNFSVADTGDDLREIAQAMLRDPSVIARIFKPGVATGITPGRGNHETDSLGFTHRRLFAAGKLYDLSFGSHELSENYRDGRPEKQTLGWLNLAASPNYRTHLLGQYVYTGREQALPGATSDQTPSDRSSFWSNAWDLSSRYQVSPATFAWLHLGNQLSYTVDQIANPREATFDRGSRFTVFSRTPSRQLGVEGRLDHRWGGGHTTSYAVFAGRLRLNERELIYDRTRREFDETHTSVRDRIVAHTFQHDYRPGSRLSLILGTTAERFTSAFTIERPGEVVRRGHDTVESRWLPFGQATYVLTDRDLVRVIAQRRRRDDFDPVLQPAEAFVVGEFPALDTVERTTNFEFDYERRLSWYQFAKLFLFRSDLKDLHVSPVVQQTLKPLGFFVDQARIAGFGVRYERQIGPFLSSYLRYTYRKVTDESKGAPESGQVPMNPLSRVTLGLNYVDRAATKIFAEINWSDRMTLYQSTERFPATWVVNLRFAKEPSVRREWVFSIQNLFDTGTIYWREYPSGDPMYRNFPAAGRAYRLQYSIRF